MAPISITNIEGVLLNALDAFMKLHNPLPESLQVTCSKAASILEHFLNHSKEVDKSFIPTKILENARGIAIMTIVKAGVLWSGRLGTGLVVSRLPDGKWSAPSCICCGGVGVGAQFGAQITDCVFILNNEDAVKAFSHGNVTLGGNISVAAGPTGRSAETAGAIAHLAPIYSYSKSKGFFAGITLEGTVILTRKNANEAAYGKGISAMDLLSGKITQPPQAEPLYRMLNIKFGNLGRSLKSLAMDEEGSVETLRSSTTNVKIQKTPTITRPAKPSIKPKKAEALYDFQAQQDGDLGFKEGDVIWVLEYSNDNQWWKGSLNGRQGVFPANYVQLLA